MGVLVAAPVQELVTSLAKCCWCGESLRRARQKDVWGPWACFQPSCWQRQLNWSVTTHPKGKPSEVKDWLFCPVPKQVEFFEATRLASRVLFGGAAGGAKSHTVRWGLYRDCLRIPNLNCLLLRRTYKELDATHLREMMRDAALIGAKFLAGDKRLIFPNGSVIQAGHCETDADAMAYLSTEYDRIAFDELVTFQMGPSLEIMSRARTSKPEVIAEGGAQVWGATNPGGRGALWVHAFFVTKVVDPEAFPNYNPSRYAYVKADLHDNPYLDPSYRQTLEELPPTRRRQLLDGDWLCFDGQFFDWQATKGEQPWHIADQGVAA